MKVALSALLIPVALMGQAGPTEARKAFDAAERAAKLGITAEAVRDYERAVSLDPRFAEAWCRLGELQLSSREFEASRKSLHAAIAANPDYPAAYGVLARLEHDTGDWTGLLSTTERMLRIDPGENRLNYMFHAIANYNLRHPEAAERSIREAIRLDPRHEYLESWRLLGEMLFQRRDYAGAAGPFREYLRFAKPGPQTDAVRARLADVENRPPATGQSDLVFRADSDLALVRFQFVPRAQQLVTDLRPEDIEIKEDRVPQKIAVFEGGRYYPRRVPLEITLLFDCSNSVHAAGTLQPHVFETTLLNEYENVTIAVYGFSQNLVRLTSPTRYGPALEQAMDAVSDVQPGNTPLFSAIAETARRAAANGGNAVRMMVIFSDGQADEDDIAGYDGAADAAERLGISLYPVSLPSAAVPRDMRDVLTKSMSRFRDLASRTGGESFRVSNTGDVLPEILGALARRVRYDYVAGFYPSVLDVTRKRHSVEVSLRPGNKGEITGGKRLLEH